jgi:hypothetical protein
MDLANIRELLCSSEHEHFGHFAGLTTFTICYPVSHCLLGLGPQWLGLFSVGPTPDLLLSVP